MYQFVTNIFFILDKNSHQLYDFLDAENMRVNRFYDELW